jgi:hypothetical protein
MVAAVFDDQHQRPGVTIAIVITRNTHFARCIRQDVRSNY